MKNYFAKNLRYLRKDNNMKLSELSDILGYKSYTTISKWESEDSEPVIGMAKNIADYFDVTLEELVNTDIEKTRLEELVSKNKNKNNTIYKDDNFQVNSGTRLIKNNYKDVFGDQLLSMTEEKQLDRQTMINYLRELPMSAYGEGINIYNMNDDELYKLYTMLTEKEAD